MFLLRVSWTFNCKVSKTEETQNLWTGQILESKKCVGTNGTGQAAIPLVTVLHQTQPNKS